MFDIATKSKKSMERRCPVRDATAENIQHRLRLASLKTEGSAVERGHNEGRGIL
jgi:hypothetical protein